jgi:hypothetical protein
LLSLAIAVVAGLGGQLVVLSGHILNALRLLVKRAGLQLLRVGNGLVDLAGRAALMSAMRSRDCAAASRMASLRVSSRTSFGIRRGSILRS